MNVVTLCCTLNEERNIGRFCEVYGGFADWIVICDGGSTDKTVEIALRYPEVQVVHFEEQMDFGGIKWNHKGKQYSLGLRAARTFGADWITVDDCDSVPTLALRDSIRSIMRKTRADVIGVQRLYVIGESEFFPTMSLKGHHGWAFRAELDTGYYESKHMGLPRRNFPDIETWHKIGPPYGLLHYGWPDEATIQMKLARYRAIGKLPSYGSVIPPHAGEPAPLPDWAIWKETE